MAPSPSFLWSVLGVVIVGAGCSTAASRRPVNPMDGAVDPVGGAGTSGPGTAGGGGTGGAAATGTGGTGTAGGGSGGSATPGPDAAAGMPGKDAAAGEAGNDGPAPPAPLGPAGGACPGGPYVNPLPTNLNATLVKSFPGELEGPAWVAAQKALYFVQSGGGSNNGLINKYTPADGKFVVFASNVGVGGLAVDPDGMLVAASYDSRSLTRFDPATGKRTDVAGGSRYNGQPFDEVNDVVVRGDGNMYFSDPNYSSPPGNQPQAFYRLSPPPESKVSLVFMANNANGIALSPDGAWLFVATTDNGGTPLRRIPVAADGSVSGQGTTWKEASSDGMAVDCAGNLYLSVAGNTNVIKVISATDQALGNIVGLGGGYVTNSAFGDDDRKTLYITTSEGLYKIQMNVPGFPN